VHSRFLDDNSKILEILAKMKKKGVKIDKELLDKKKVEAAPKAKELKDKMFSQVGKFNPNSSSQVAEVLFNRLGLPPIKKDEESWSTDDEVLKVLTEDGCQIAEDLRNYRRVQFLIQCCQEIEKKLDKDGICHPNYSLNSSTGRVYYFKPALQRVPKNLREVIIAREGKVFILADYKQIDVRIIAHFSNDKDLIKTFRSKEDIYKIVMRELELKDRDMAKNVCLSIFYGRGYLGLSKILHISQVEAQKYIEKFFKRYKGVKISLTPA